MEKKDLFEKYSHIECEFKSLDRGALVYECSELNLLLCGTLDNRDRLDRIETIGILMQLEDFNFIEMRKLK